MIFLSAQPQELYFLWQLEVQFKNFENVGIDLSNVYALVGYKGEIEESWKTFAKNTKANILFYKDEIPYRNYLSSIRPHIISKFFKEYPQLVNEYCFYHDQDIIFRELPLFEGMMDGRVHLSDTVSYIGYKYIIEKGTDVLLDMCEIVGINPSVVRFNQNNSGGAQYFFKGLDSTFWSKVETDGELLYKCMGNVIEHEVKWRNQNHVLLSKLQVANIDNSYHAIQGWCADMWAVLWNIWLLDKKTYVNPELAFSWATGTIDDYNRLKIFHNAGVTGQEGLFHKQQWKTKKPFGLNLKVNDNSAQKPYVDLLNSFSESSIDFEIVSAYYGNRKKLDVTEDVKFRISDKKQLLKVEGFPDLERGYVKTLSINYILNGVTSYIEAQEGRVISFIKRPERLAIYYTNNIKPQLVDLTLNQISKITSSENVDLIVSTQKPLKVTGVIAQLNAISNEATHFNICRQILQCLLYAKSVNDYKYVSFLEHDVLYPEGYFKYKDFSGAAICNMNYGGVNAEGFQYRLQPDQPLHQITMNFEVAIEWFSSQLIKFINSDGNLEPNELGIVNVENENQSIHINHGSNFTSHFNIYSKETIKDHPYWGNVSKYYDVYNNTR